ncbi:hypothetical protein NC652_017390 [Populus alba x Populus x berolinensis]|nr:hypothetical protein NC652_017390 [Populus alba x Populus x berolinensis]
MSQTGKLMPNLDQQSTKVLNLTVLQRMDPFIEEILITAAHVTFYAFNIETNQWSRKDVEGSLFDSQEEILNRGFSFIVMNRRNTENLVENLLGDFEYEVQAPYLLYRNQSQEVNGIWFYNRRECEDVANLFTRILNAYSKVPAKPKVASGKSEYEELEAVPIICQCLKVPWNHHQLPLLPTIALKILRLRTSLVIPFVSFDTLHDSHEYWKYCF